MLSRFASAIHATSMTVGGLLSSPTFTGASAGASWVAVCVVAVEQAKVEER